MQNKSQQASDHSRFQINRPTFSCWECIGNEREDENEINLSVYGPSLRKSRQGKISLKNTHVPSTIIVPIQSETTLAKSKVGAPPAPSGSNPVRITNKIDKQSIEASRVRSVINKNNSLKSFAEEMPFKSMSMRSTDSTGLLLSSSRPRINFSYTQQENQKQAHISNSTIPEEPLTPMPILLRQKDSQISMSLSPFQSDKDLSKNEHQNVENRSSSEHSSQISPLNKIYKTSQKEMLVSLEFCKKSSKNSNGDSQKLRIKRMPSHNEPFTKAAMKVRQTVSIKEPEEESDQVSVVVTNSLLNSFTGFTGLLIPIDENEMETGLSACRE